MTVGFGRGEVIGDLDERLGLTGAGGWGAVKAVRKGLQRE